MKPNLQKMEKRSLAIWISITVGIGIFAAVEAIINKSLISAGFAAYFFSSSVFKFLYLYKKE